MATEAQIQANRENAQLSTGPQDTSKTRFNARTHGLCSRKLFREKDKEELELILQDLIDDLKPRGILELRIIENMALWLWERQRVIEADFVVEHNEIINSEACNLEERKQFIIDETIYIKEPSKEDLAKAQELRKQYKHVYLSSELYTRYKIEAENRFYKAVKMLTELKKANEIII